MKTREQKKLVTGLKSTLCAALIVGTHAAWNGQAQGTGPRLLHPHLGVRTITTNLDSPTSLAFIGANDMLVLEKATGRVQRFVNGELTSTVLDLPVN
ncbi:MAG TPA: hypothetical protein VEL06_13425, partial [Haliangiales bacterium]|nr:hypothetical protein [Haliangiales bacterium]